MKRTIEGRIFLSTVPYFEFRTGADVKITEWFVIIEKPLFRLPE